MALVPGAAATSFRRAIKDNFGSLLMTILASVDSQRAQATKPEDKERIFAQIEGSIGFDELNIRVITLLNEWLRKQHAEVSGTPWEQRDARSQVLDFMGRMAAIREEVKSMGLDPTIQHRADDGVLFIGGEGGIILGCTDASAYVSAQPPSDAPAHDETADTSAAPRDAPSRTTKRARCNDNGAGTAALGEAVGGDDAAAMEAEEPIPLDEHIPERLKDGRVCERYSATLVQVWILSSLSLCVWPFHNADRCVCTLHRPTLPTSRTSESISLSCFLVLSPCHSHLLGHAARALTMLWPRVPQILQAAVGGVRRFVLSVGAVRAGG